MKIIFMGTPDFAAVCLDGLIQAGHEICGVLTQPDRPKNRGHKIVYSPVKELALKNNILILQPESLRNEIILNEICDKMREMKPDLIAVAAYGKILPEKILNIAKYGAINVHASLLPKYRGAAPIQRAIMAGETETGISIQYMAKELDAGDIILEKKLEIGEHENAAELTARLAVLGAEVLLQAIEDIKSGAASRTPQNHALAVYAPMLSRNDSPIDWTRPAHMIDCQVRGLIPWPCAEMVLPIAGTVKIWSCEETGEKYNNITPGKLIAADKKGLKIVCGDGNILLVKEIQAKGGKKMPFADWYRGHPFEI